MKIAIPDLVSNSYFPAIAAVDLGFFKKEGLDMELELIFPVDHTLEKMRDGEIDFVGGSAHSTPHAFPGWKGGKLLGALAQGMYWFLILRSDLGAGQGDIEAVKGLNIGAAPLVDLGLKHLLIEYGIDLEADKVNIAPVPGAFTGKNVNFGVTAARALQDGKIDGFWANGMGAEVAVKSGAGTLVIDARRGDGPSSAFNYTMPALITSEKLINENPDACAAAVRALVKTQNALKDNYQLATEVGRNRFPAEEAELIADIIQRDLPFYNAAITPEFISGMSSFSQAMGLIDNEVTYEDAVATEFSNLWNA
ncbi:MAG: nitrate ABC transporter substrate-binding protein [Rhodospirillaceae bacterium]|nr:nitrate ABC transporter substrate-binding protein [Rhodospirillaceae bacterium]OUT79159.1 MAG: nitrate ABC transporter substrate-binding protein [Rhodospirillaceae bacterium TMED23]|tara:strand:- start:5461 stop:6387 length:927 start_codon:yes stop_codon:yes gene_type:complete